MHLLSIIIIIILFVNINWHIITKQNKGYLNKDFTYKAFLNIQYCRFNITLLFIKIRFQMSFCSWTWLRSVIFSFDPRVSLFNITHVTLLLLFMVMCWIKDNQLINQSVSQSIITKHKNEIKCGENKNYNDIIEAVQIKINYRFNVHQYWTNHCHQNYQIIGYELYHE